MTRIAFSADWHVDEYGNRIDPETGLNARLLDYVNTAGGVAREAKSLGAEALVVAGDFSERRHPSPWLVARIAEALDVGPAKVILGRGNHDGERSGRSIVDVLGSRPGWTGSGRPATHFVGTTAVCVLPYLDKSWIRTQPGLEAAPQADVFRILGEQYVAMAAGLYASATKAGARSTVLVGHQTLAGAQMSDSQFAFLGDMSLVIDARALAGIGFDAVVFGHLHRHQEVLPGVLYAGSIERVDFGEQDETKGFIVADVGPGRFDWTFVETPARRWVTFDDATIGDARALAPGSIVRARFADPDVDVADVRRFLEELGAFAITEIAPGRRVPGGDATTGLSESLTPAEALGEYFADEDDREALVERGRELLASVA